MPANFNSLLTDARVLKLKEIFAGSAELFLVGGCVRDFLVSKQTKDLDFTCALSPSEMLSLLETKGIRCIETGLRHGTATAVIDQSNLEITSFRGDSGDTVNALHSDLGLRDFTINAIAVSAVSGKVFDPHSGIEDLGKKILRAPLSPVKRFTEDPLRIMRMIRFGPAQDFSVEPDTYLAAKEHIDELQSISVERIQHEFSRIIVSANVRKALKMMLEIGLIEALFPEAMASVGFEQNDFHTESVFEHTLSVIENCPPELKLRLAAFFHDLGKPSTLSVDDEGRRHFYEHEIESTKIAKNVMERLRFSNELSDSVSTIVRYHMRPINCGPSGIRRLLRDLGDQFESWSKFKEADHPPIFSIEQTLAELQAFDDKVMAEHTRAALDKQKRLSVDGYELMNIGYQAGPGLGKVIKQLEEEVIDDPVKNSKEYLLVRAKELLTLK